MVNLIWTEFALEDLHEIHSYISKGSKFYADRYIDKLFTRVEQLISNPKPGRIVPEFNIENIRELIEGNYRIIYKVDADTVSIIRVHHAARLLK